MVLVTNDRESVSTAIAGLQWQRRFPSMTQALQAADNVVTDGRDDAQNAIMVVPDRKYTSAYRTTMKVTALEDKGVQILIAPIAESSMKNL